LRSVAEWIRTADLDTVRAAIWAIRACRSIHSAPHQLGVRAPGLPTVPRVGADAFRGVEHVLWLRAERCLVSASVRQSWLAAHDDQRDVIIGVTLERPGQLLSHAWLSGEDSEGEGFDEVTRIPCP
jgi:hypothetical protein